MRARNWLSNFFHRHPLVAAGFCVVFCAGFIAWDVSRIVSVWGAGAALVPGLSLGVGLSLVTALWFWWKVKKGARLRDGEGRALDEFGGGVWVWTGIVLLVFVYGHPQGRSDYTPRDGMEVASIIYTVFAFCAAMVLSVRGWMRLWVHGEPDMARPHCDEDLIEVCHIRDKSLGVKDEPFFVAMCHCGWSGDIHDSREDGAREGAYRDARTHGSRVSLAISYPLD